MNRDGVDQFFDEFKERFRRLVRETVAEELEPLRDLLLRPAGEDEPPDVEQLVEAAEVARLLGYDLSTDGARRRSTQKVYDLARRGLLPSVRVSPRRVRFDPAAVKRQLASGGLAQPYATPRIGDAAEKACATARR